LSAEILVKFEATNPGGSIKDRVAKRMVENALKTGKLGPGGTIIEATAGNTGVGLAQAAAVYGLRSIFVMPDKMSADKIRLLKAYGAEVVITPTAVPPDSPESYNGVADRLAREIPGAFRPSQFDNPDNPEAHYHGTGPEIWQQTGGHLDVLVAGMGTGGTISGTGLYLKDQDPTIHVIGADPEGSILSGDSPKSWKVEGIGEDFIPKNFNRQVVDEFIRVSDRESFGAARRLAREEGILAGGSAGTALAAALKFARRSTRPLRIVVILPDTGRNYLSKFYDDQWLQDNRLAGGDSTASLKVGVIPQGRELLAVNPEDDLTIAFALMGTHGISQLPVLQAGRQVGSIHESTLMRVTHDGNPASCKVADLMAQPFPELESEASLDEAYRLLLSGHSAILVTERGAPRQVVTRFDLIVHQQRSV
jgi:cystathionine beta-synthase